MAQLLLRDGALGWLLAAPFVLAAAFVADSWQVRALVVAFGLGLTELGIDVLRDATTD